MGKRLYIQLYNAKSGESLTLPINPEEIELTKEKDIKTYNILNYGEVAVKGNRQLQRFTLSGLLPKENTHFSLLASLVRQLAYRRYSLSESKDMINRWIDNNDIIRVIISGVLNIECMLQRSSQTIREYTEDEQFSIEFIEYRMPRSEEDEEEDTELGIEKEVKRNEEKLRKQDENKKTKLKKRKINKFIPAQIVGKKGQTLYKLAMLVYGGRVKELMDKNGITNPNMSIAGMVVEMLPL